MKSFNHTIKDQLGIHARPAGLLVKEANKFASGITITKGEKKVDAKKIFAVMSLAAKHGDIVTLCAEGDDEDDAIAALQMFMDGNL
ncbi:MAG: HPr family phosphocarrier protein [Clostridiales bacterium]|jgi:phosphocarrier protein|nr:HPr family phosphocarrier protein [Clostridiales bacterium]